ncbi:VOC family protein [Nocardioides gilvus]|uniref:VOC family protein n=1 Tax=Nocardioides gilvus TaxID=1735589 RepID=UPI000D748D6B|nr:VOC family protein [Nocardioides gilvus]
MDLTTGPARLLAVNHVGVSVQDMAAARRFWVEVLGAEEYGAFGWAVGTTPADDSLGLLDTAADVLLLRTDAAFMELFAFSSPAPRARPARRPGVSALTWAVSNVEGAVLAARATGSPVTRPGVVECPDGTEVRLVPAGDGPRGLMGVEVLVEEPAAHVFAGVAGPVALTYVPGEALGGAPSPVDHGVNHLCLDVRGIEAISAAATGVQWNHPVTESSGGAAAVRYGTTADGVLVELLESRSDQAFLARCRLSHGHIP